MRNAVVLFVTLLAYVLAQNVQLDPFIGRYLSPCVPFGPPGSQLTATHYLHMSNNGHAYRVDIFVSNPTCQGGFDLAIEGMGILNVNFPPTPAAPLVNLDLGQEFKMGIAVTDAGLGVLNGACGTDRFRLNVAMPFRGMTCPDLHIVPFSQCPVHYTVGVLSGTTLQFAATNPPVCTAASRPTDLGTNPYQLTRAQHYPWFGGLWQSPCITTPEGNSFSNELEVRDDMFYSGSLFEYQGPGCVPANLRTKRTSGGELFGFQPLSPTQQPLTVQIEFRRFMETIYPVTADAATWLTNQAANEQCGFLTFTANTLADISNVTCPQIFAQSVFSCPRAYDIASVQGNQLFFGRLQPQTSICSPANRPTELSNVPSTQQYHFPTPNNNVGAVVILVLLIFALAGAAGWVFYKHRGNTLKALRELCCGGYSSRGGDSFSEATPVTYNATT